MKTVVGSQRVPISRLPVLLKDVEKLYESNGNQVFTIDKMITDLGSKPKSSSVPTKIPDLKHFGLLEGSYQGFRITDIGQKILQQDNTQRSVLLDKVVRNIKLWGIFQNNGGRDITENTVVKLLIQETGVKEDEAKKRSREIKWAFLQDAGSINEFKPKHRLKLTLKKPQTQGQQEQGLSIEVPVKNTDDLLDRIESEGIAPQPEPHEEETIVSPEPIAAKTQIESVVQPTDRAREIEPSVQPETEVNPLEEEPKPSEKITKVSQDLIGLAKYLPSTEKVTIEFGEVKFELRDESSIELAKVLIQVKENGLLRGNDHEQK